MRRTLLTKLTSCLVAIVHVIFSVLVATSGLAHAQAVDLDPPSIELQVVEEGVRGETQVFSATVTDNNELLSMTLHYRFGSDGAYESVPMSVISGTSIYTASVDTDSERAGVIQYYMEARDTGGNRTVQGFAFDPFERTLVEDNQAVVADVAPAAGTVVPVVAPPMSNQRKIVYGLLGLLIVGGLASAASGGSSGGSAPASQVDLTILVDRFQ